METMKHNIFLIGFMGTGKSAVSSCLRNSHGMEDVDIDCLIAEKEGKSIPDIFKINGEEYFRDCESQMLISLLDRTNTVISCGGGIILREQNVKLMKECGKIILLTATPQTIYERIKDNQDRPILNGNMNPEYIATLMEQRREKYEKAADIVIQTDNKTIDQVSTEILEKNS